MADELERAFQSTLGGFLQAMETGAKVGASQAVTEMQAKGLESKFTLAEEEMQRGTEVAAMEGLLRLAGYRTQEDIARIQASVRGRGGGGGGGLTADDVIKLMAEKRHNTERTADVQNKAMGIRPKTVDPRLDLEVQTFRNLMNNPTEDNLRRANLIMSRWNSLPVSDRADKKVLANNVWGRKMMTEIPGLRKAPGIIGAPLKALSPLYRAIKPGYSSAPRSISRAVVMQAVTDRGRELVSSALKAEDEIDDSIISAGGEGKLDLSDAEAEIATTDILTKMSSGIMNTVMNEILEIPSDARSPLQDEQLKAIEALINTTGGLNAAASAFAQSQVNRNIPQDSEVAGEVFGILASEGIYFDQFITKAPDEQKWLNAEAAAYSSVEQTKVLSDLFESIVSSETPEGQIATEMYNQGGSSSPLPGATEEENLKTVSRVKEGYSKAGKATDNNYTQTGYKAILNFYQSGYMDMINKIAFDNRFDDPEYRQTRDYIDQEIQKIAFQSMAGTDKSMNDAFKSAQKLEQYILDLDVKTGKTGIESTLAYISRGLFDILKKNYQVYPVTAKPLAGEETLK